MQTNARLLSHPRMLSISLYIYHSDFAIHSELSNVAWSCLVQDGKAICLVYLGTIVVFRKTLLQQINRLRKVLALFYRTGVTL